MEIKVSRTCYELMQNLKQRRLARKLDLKDLSLYLKGHGINRSAKTIYGWENGLSEPPLEAVLLMTAYLGCPHLLQFPPEVSSTKSLTEVSSPESLTETQHLSGYEQQLIKQIRENRDFQTIVSLLLSITAQ